MWYIRPNGSNFQLENQWLKFLCALLMPFFFVVHHNLFFFLLLLSCRDLREPFTLFLLVDPKACRAVWLEDYFTRLTKLKTFLHAKCHVLLWYFKIGMFNKLFIILLLLVSSSSSSSFFMFLWFHSYSYYSSHSCSSLYTITFFILPTTTTRTITCHFFLL